MDRAEFLAQLEESQTKGLWCAPWPAAMKDLSPAEASWRQGPERHSIWQLVNHVSYWRLFAANRAYGRARPADEEIARHNWEEPAEATAGAWETTLVRLEESYHAVRLAAEDAKADVSGFRGLVAHDHYHLGQIMLLRAMQGKAPVE